MRNAPAVNYPVVRSLFAAWALAVLWAIGAFCALTFAANDRQHPWVFVLTLLTCLVFGLVALDHWRKLPVGVLVWNRKQWQFAFAGSSSAKPVELIRVSVRLDFQSTMLACFHTSTGRRIWVWLGEGKDGTKWRKLRQAIFSKPRLTDPERGILSSNENRVTG